MREFDTNGLRLAEFQGKIFEESTNLNCSSLVFLRRFFNSDFLKQLDKNDSSMFTLDPKDSIYYIKEQFGDFNYGSVKYSKEALFWLGYLYRYISYTRNVTTRFLFKTFNPKDIISLYYVYHTQSMEWCISSILDIYNLSEEFFDPNYRLKELIINKLSRLKEEDKK